MVMVMVSFLQAAEGRSDFAVADAATAIGEADPGAAPTAGVAGGIG
jgi:hypothetical protein